MERRGGGKRGKRETRNGSADTSAGQAPLQRRQMSYVMSLTEQAWDARAKATRGKRQKKHSITEGGSSKQGTKTTKHHTNILFRVQRAPVTVHNCHHMLLRCNCFNSCCTKLVGSEQLLQSGTCVLQPNTLNLPAVCSCLYKAVPLVRLSAAPARFTRFCAGACDNNSTNTVTLTNKLVVITIC